MLLLREDFGLSISTLTKLGIEVATLDGRGFLGDIFNGSRIFTEARFTVLLCFVGGADATKERPSRFSGMEWRAVSPVQGGHIG